MANETWRASYQAVAHAATKYMIDLYNAASSTKYIRVYRIFYFNNHGTAVTATNNVTEIRRITAASGGTTITPVAHDPRNTTLNAYTTAGTGRSCTPATVYLFRRVLWDSDELVVTTANRAALEATVPFAELWNAGYADSNIQPITCRAGQDEGVAVYNTAGTVGTVDPEMEFTSTDS